MFSKMDGRIGKETSKQRFMWQCELGSLPLYLHILDPLSTIIHKIFETDSTFHVKQRTTGKVQFLFFPSLTSFGNSWGSYILVYTSLLLIITLRFTHRERKICSTIEKSQILWIWLSAKFFFVCYVFINSFEC